MIASVVRIEAVGALWRRRTLFFTVFATIVAATLLALIILPKRYVATGSVIVAEQEPVGDHMPDTWAMKLGDPADLESQLLLVRSSRVLRLVMASPGAAEAARTECLAASTKIRELLFGGSAEACERLGTDADAFLDYVQSRYSVGSVGRSRVINISYQSPLPAVAQTMANALVMAFLDDQRSNMSSSREDAAGWLWKEAGDLENRLNKEEGEIQAFRRANGLLRGATAPITSERLTSINQQLSLSEAARSEAAAHLAEITTSRGGGPGNAPAVLASRSIADLKQQLTAVESELANNTTVLGPNHPTVMALKRQRDSVQARMASEITAIAASARQTLDTDTAQVEALRRQMYDLKAQAGAANEAEASIADMVHDVEIKRGQYADLYKRASELETERRVLMGNTRLVALAERSDKPFFPKTIPFLAAGLTLATLLAATAAIARDRVDGSLRTGVDLAQIAGVPVLAHLPIVGRSSRAGLSDLLRLRSADAPPLDVLGAAQRDLRLQDGLRNLFAKLTLDKKGARGSVVLLTSTMPREGKTMTTLSLAALVAAAGWRVLVVESDMRRPVFEHLLKLEQNLGLNAVLRGIAHPDDVVVRTGIPNLDAIPAGRATAHSTELLLGRHMTGFLRWARSYDFVLIDSPPVGLLMDACVLARQVDRVLCCARWGRSQVAATEETVRILKTAGAGAMGMVVTMAEPAGGLVYDLRAAPRRRPISAEAA